MKTTITHQKNNFKKLIKVLGIGALMGLGLKANAQQGTVCQAHFYSYPDSSSVNTINFWNYSGGNHNSFSWDFGDSTTSTLENPYHVFAHSGIHHVCLTITDTSINCQNTYCEDVFVGNHTNGCQAYFYGDPDPNTVNGMNFWNYSGGTATDFSWDFGDSATSTLENPNHIYANAGTFQVCLTITDSSTNCQNTYCEYVYVGHNGGNGCQAYFYSELDSGTVNGIHFLNYSGGTGSVHSYFWDFGDNHTSTLENPNHVYANAGTYYVCLTIADDSTTCSYCEHVYVGENEQCHAYYYYHPDSSSANSINLWNYSGGMAVNFSWDFGDGDTSNLENPNHVFADGAYLVCLTVTDSNGIACSYCEHVVVGNNGCEAYFYSEPDSTLDNVIYFSNYSGGTSGSYSWDFGDSTASNLGTPHHVFSDSGTYNVCLTIAGQDGTTCTFCDSVVALQLMPAGINESRNVNTVLENYPNPFNGITTIRYSVSKNAAVELTIIDLMGSKIATIESSNKSTGNYSTVWNAENVSNGMYLLQLRVNNQVTTKRIIIAK